ncbi:MAG: 50S ribosomal protein L23 [uncultured bacterium]|nr:MAG: 50S ribosomal protein L23 [uncultured bacterium]
MAILKRKTTDVTVEAKAPKAVAKKTVVGTPSSVQAIRRVLLGAHVSEKAASVEASGVYTFRVAGDATKGEVVSAIHANYGIKPVAVRMLNIEGKNVRFGRSMGKRKDWKKAIVTLPKESHIDIHSGI